MSDPRLYILMRTDLVDLNPGKAMAQAAHAANQFAAQARKTQGKPFNTFAEWAAQGDNFGTTIVLGATKREIEQLIPLAASEGYISGFTFDTSYPIKDGNGEPFTVNALTCAYIFIGPYTDSYETEIQLRKLPLHA